MSGRVADAADLPFDDGSFDHVIAMHMMYHVTDPAKAITQFHRVLRTGGKVAITTNGETNLQQIFSIGADVFGGHRGDPAAKMFSAAMAQDLLAADFGDVTVQLFTDEYAVGDADDIYHYLTSFPPGNQASDAQLETLRARISETLSKAGGVLKVHRESALISATARSPLYRKSSPE